jgi:hypothetical protein
MPFINKKWIEADTYYSASEFIDALLEAKLKDNFILSDNAFMELHDLMLANPELAAKVDEFAVVLAMCSENTDDMKKFLRMVEKFKGQR